MVLILHRAALCIIKLARRMLYGYYSVILFSVTLVYDCTWARIYVCVVYLWTKRRSYKLHLAARGTTTNTTSEQNQSTDMRHACYYMILCTSMWAKYGTCYGTAAWSVEFKIRASKAIKRTTTEVFILMSLSCGHRLLAAAAAANVICTFT